ncbi:MAG: hypothetical protein ACO3B7_05180, partial [Candidatus Limnocylindrus sp.]
MSKDQEDIRSAIDVVLDHFELEPRALGRSDYPDGLPLREILVIGRHCAGGIILGFEVTSVQTAIRRATGEP